jgi:hypothetical protein
MFQQVFCRWSLSVSSTEDDVWEQTYGSWIPLNTLSDEILERSGELGIVKLRGWIFGNDEQDLSSALSLDSGVLMSCAYFHRMQISIGWFTHSKLDSRDTCKSAGIQWRGHCGADQDSIYPLHTHIQTV